MKEKIMRLKYWPFFTYFGGKWRIATKYPDPKYKIIIEPFAGSAGYSVKYAHPKVKLYDINEKIVSVWNYLINVKEKEILKLPEKFKDVRNTSACQEAQWLIGFWLNKGHTQPCYKPSKWMRDKIRPNSMWGKAIKYRIISQLSLIRNWTCELKSFEDIPNINATYFIDPPYQRTGHLYPFKDIDYDFLSKWCQTRKGQIIVCETSGANWLNFKSLGEFKALEGKKGKKITKEYIWLN